MGAVAQPVALIYAYVEGMLERRAPHREAHLELVRRWSDDGRLRMAGALGDPPSGALFVFEVEDPAEVADFTAADPYGEAGLVVDSRIEPWTLVASAPLRETG